MRYEINDGRVLSWSVEVHLVDHCNLRCANCCTLSPHLAPRLVDPAQFERDLRQAARALRPALLKLTGGEPLLHPELPRLLRIATGSGLARQVSLTTNGLLLPAVPDETLALLDRLTLSRYPAVAPPPAAIDAVRERCDRLGVHLTVKEAPVFQVMDAPAPYHDDPEAAAVHAACWLRHRCHTLRAGRFYACTRPAHLEDHLRAQGIEVDLSDADGVELEAPDLLGRLLRYLEARTPLRSCRFCLGASGGWEPHRQLEAPGC